MVTGAGGSIGSELCRQLARLGPARLVLVDNSEPALFEIDRELARERGFLNGVAVVADVKDGVRMRQVFASSPAGRDLPCSRVQARGDDGDEPARGGAEQHPRHAHGRGRRGRVRREAVRARLDRQGCESADDHGSVEGALRVDRRDVGAAGRRSHAVRRGALRERARLVGVGDPDLPTPDRARRAGDGDAPGDDAVLHDDPRGGAARRPGGRDRRARAGLRPRHGRSGADHGSGGEHDPPLGQGAGERDRDPGDRPGTGREAPRGARRRRRGRLGEPTPEDPADRQASRSRARGSTRSSRCSSASSTKATRSSSWRR